MRPIADYRGHLITIFLWKNSNIVSRLVWHCTVHCWDSSDLTTSRPQRIKLVVPFRYNPECIFISNKVDVNVDSSEGIRGAPCGGGDSSALELFLSSHISCLLLGAGWWVLRLSYSIHASSNLILMTTFASLDSFKIPTLLIPFHLRPKTLR